MKAPFAVVLALAVALEAHAQFTAIYSFSGTLSETPFVNHVTFTSLQATNTALARLSGAVVSSSGWVASGWAADRTEFLSLSLHANTGYTLDLSSLSFKTSRTSTGPQSLTVSLYVGGVLQESSGIYIPVNTNTGTTSAMGSALSFNFSDKVGIVSTALAEFRFYAWGGSSSVGTLRFDDIAITGRINAATTAVPEPSTYAIILGAAALFGATLRRHRMNRLSARTGI